MGELDLRGDSTLRSRGGNLGQEKSMFYFIKHLLVRGNLRFFLKPSDSSRQEKSN
jgi:hypothetical protein